MEMSTKYAVQFFKDGKWHTWCIMIKPEWADECEQILKKEYETRIELVGEEDV